MKLHGVPLLLAALLVLSFGCKKEPKAVAPAVPDRPVASAPPAPAAPAPEELSVPQNDVNLPRPQPIPDEALPEDGPPLRLPPPVEPQPPARAGRSRPPRQQRPAARPRVDSGNEEPATVPPPQVGSVLSQGERNRYEAEIRDSLSATRRDLAAVRRRSLSASQTSAVRRIEGFVEQAEEVRARDLPLAKNLAERAKLFMSELKRTLQ